MMQLMDKLREAVESIRKVYGGPVECGVVLGSGLGNFKDQMEVACEIPYGDIRHFPVSTVEGHKGTLIFGTLGGKPIVCMAGRFHFYEGYSATEVSFPIRVMKMLGIKALFLTNAAGGMHPGFAVGDLMIINDHISLFANNPLLGPNEKDLGPRFPDMSEPYSKTLINAAKEIAEKQGIPVFEGVYCGVTGPTFETRAEYKMLHLLGADAVGMSTVQEVIVARHMDIPVFAMSVITDLGIREELNTITHQEVLEAAAAAEPRMTSIFKELVQTVAAG